jgi:type I restriction-modification system DNA methylase subunit
MISRGRIHTSNEHIKEFIKILDNIKPSRHSYEVFNDWLVMAAASLYSWKKDKTIEEEYLKIAQNYTSEELSKHCELLAITVSALENTEQDFLGEVFTVAELTNSRNGQFFTPYHVSRMMAEMMMEEQDFSQNRICKINDPCCGAGGMLIAGAMVMKNRGVDYQRNALFIGQDIDARCARMTFIQLSLLGMSALVVCGNTLTMKIYWQRETMNYHLSDMDFRLRAEKMLDVIKDMEGPVPEERRQLPEQTVPAYKMEITSPKEYVQGELF